MRAGQTTIPTAVAPIAAKVSQKHSRAFNLVKTWWGKVIMGKKYSAAAGTDSLKPDFSPSPSNSKSVSRAGTGDCFGCRHAVS